MGKYGVEEEMLQNKILLVEREAGLIRLNWCLAYHPLRSAPGQAEGSPIGEIDFPSQLCLPVTTASGGRILVLPSQSFGSYFYLGHIWTWYVWPGMGRSGPRNRRTDSGEGTGCNEKD